MEDKYSNSKTIHAFVSVFSIISTRLLSSFQDISRRCLGNNKDGANSDRGKDPGGLIGLVAVVFFVFGRMDFVLSNPQMPPVIEWCWQD